jgi:hypothetical protein
MLGASLSDDASSALPAGSLVGEVYEGLAETWPHWYDQGGDIILTSAECAELIRQHAERLAARLWVLGVEPQITYCPPRVGRMGSRHNRTS